VSTLRGEKRQRFRTTICGGLHTINLGVDDAAIRTRRLDSGWYTRTVDITSVRFEPSRRRALVAAESSRGRRGACQPAGHRDGQRREHQLTDDPAASCRLSRPEVTLS